MQPQSDRLALLHNRDYMLLWGGQTISTLGSAASTIVFPLLILDMTGSPAAAGLEGALAYLPYLLFSLPVGALIDRWNRKRVMMLSDLGRALALLSVPVAMMFGVLTVWQLYVNAFIEGTLFVFYNTAETAALPRVVPKTQLPAANSQSMTADTLSFMIGPALGTFLYQGVSQMAPFIVDAFSYLASVVSLRFVRSPFQGERAEPGQGHLLAEIRAGIAWWWWRPLLRFMAFLNSGINLANPAIPLVLIVLAKSMGAPNTFIGILFSVGSIGGIAGALLGPRLQKRLTYGQAVPMLILYMSLAFSSMALASNIYMLALAAALVFSASPIYDIVQYSYRLALIPDELQGRVNSSFRLLAWGSRPLGAALAGVLLEVAGGTTTVLVFGFILITLSLSAFANTHVRNAPPIEAAG
jgi:MFS family permease